MQVTPPTPDQKAKLDRLMLETAKQRMAEDIKSGRAFQPRHYNGISAKYVIFDDPKPQRDISIEEIKSKIDKETLFLFAFVPFVIAEVAWDYADTCLDLAVIMRLSETKRLCRRIKELRRDYDRKRAMIDREHRQIETDNMIAFQEDYKQFFSQLNINIISQIDKEHPGLCSDSKMLTSCSYSCAVILRALFKYVGIMERRIAALLGIQTIGSIIVSELRQLDAIILQFAGEESIGNNNQFPKSLMPFVDTLVNYLLASEMIELPCPID